MRIIRVRSVLMEGEDDPSLLCRCELPGCGRVIKPIVTHETLSLPPRPEAPRMASMQITNDELEGIEWSEGRGQLLFLFKSTNPWGFSTDWTAMDEIVDAVPLSGPVSEALTFDGPVVDWMKQMTPGT